MNFGRYEIIEELGQGAMGAVYKARDPMMDRVVAIKTILTHAAEGPQGAEYRERFFREARAAGRLSHPGIVTVYDVSEHEGTPFLVMEYIPGRTLQSILESGERFTVERCCEIGQQLADALGYAHQNGVIHRDIKPANVLITTDNRAKIADFGVAKLSAVQVTSTGQLLGTPAFMAPEQFTGSPIDGRADLFALGVVLYWLATGDKPFSGDTVMALSYKIVHTDPIPPRKLNPAIPRDFEAVIWKCMEKDPAARYPSGTALADDLRALIEGRPLATMLGAPGPTLDPNKTVVATQSPPLASSASYVGEGTGIPVVEAHDFDTAETMAVISPRTGLPSSGISVPPSASSSPGLAAPQAHPAVTPTLAAQPPTVAAPPPPPPQTESRTSIARLLVYALMVVAVVIGATQIVKTLKQKPALQQQESAAVTAPPQPAPPAPGAPSEKKESAAKPAPAKKVEVTASAKHLEASPSRPATTKPGEMVVEINATARTMVVFHGKDKPAATYNMQPGDTVTARASEQASLFTTNAGGLSLKLNGKPLPSLGSPGETRQISITPDGIAKSQSLDPREISRKLRVPTPNVMVQPPAPGMPAPGEEAFATGRGAANVIGSAARQRELARTPDSARVRIQARGIPDLLTVIVFVDGEVLYRRDGAVFPSGGASKEENRKRAQEVESAATPINEDRFVPPGAHRFEVFIGFAQRRMGAAQHVSGEFDPRQTRKLRIEFSREAGSGASGERASSRFTVVLE